MEPIVVDDPETNKVNSPDMSADLPVVGRNESGIGYPYAPQDWPNPGDNWKWKVGSRVSKCGLYVNRYLYAPNSLPKPRAFVSKTSLEQYIRKEFPYMDVHEFFANFSWDIPGRKPISPISDLKASSSSKPSRDMKEYSESESQLAKCPVGNKSCKGLLLEAEEPNMPIPMPCDVCCTQSDFCLHCSCILCSKAVKSSFGGYSYFRCESVINGSYICGHVAHLNCALKCNMAGKLGAFKLDAEYYCRRCDARSDLVPHATKFWDMCKSVDSVSDLVNILKLLIGILRGSQREHAQVLLNNIETVFYKLKNGSLPNDIWEAEENQSPTRMEGINMTFGDSSDEQEINPLKLDDAINSTLQTLKRSQEAEYRQAEEKLKAQKTYLSNLQKQLQYERSQIASAHVLEVVGRRTEQIKSALNQLKEMQEAVFARTHVLEKFTIYTEVS